MKITERTTVMTAGALLGVFSVLLVYFGNPANMGFCIACFIRDFTGSLQFQTKAGVQYARPEILGLILGSFLISSIKKEFSPRGGSSTMLRFFISVFVMIGALVFLGCPARMWLRIAGGDLNAVVGLVGYILGIGVGAIFLNKGFSLGRAYLQKKTEGSIGIVVTIALVLVVLFVPSLLINSSKAYAPAVLSLVLALILGGVAQRSRLCTVGSFRDFFLFRDTTLLTGSLMILLTAFIGNIITGNFHLGFANQPIAHTEALWNILGLFVVGFGSVLIGGCPLRQLILAGEGNTDSMVCILGLATGAALAHNFGLASSSAGTTSAGRIAVLLGIAFLFVIAGTVRKEVVHAN